jgi:deazaflavin-dependent oxidoreductase (nitroreductase family)
MHARYRLTQLRRLANAAMRGLLWLGVPVDTTQLLTVRGRRSGRLHHTPVTLVEDGGQRWLVAPYGSVAWVHNVRASGEATLSRGRRHEVVHLEELPADEAAPILREYARRVAVTRPYFDALPDAPVESFRAEAARHPVFHILPVRSSRLRRWHIANVSRTGFRRVLGARGTHVCH